MSPSDDHVTWRELDLALGPIKEDIGEIKSDVKAIRESASSNAWLGTRGRSFVNTVVGGALLALITTAISVAVGILIH